VLLGVDFRTAFGVHTLVGDELVEKAEQMLGNEAVSYLHVHYAAPGCFAVRVEREE